MQPRASPSPRPPRTPLDRRPGCRRASGYSPAGEHDSDRCAIREAGGIPERDRRQGAAGRSLLEPGQERLASRGRRSGSLNSITRKPLSVRHQAPRRGAPGTGCRGRAELLEHRQVHGFRGSLLLRRPGRRGAERTSPCRRLFRGRVSASPIRFVVARPAGSGTAALRPRRRRRGTAPALRAAPPRENGWSSAWAARKRRVEPRPAPGRPRPPLCPPRAPSTLTTARRPARNRQRLRGRPRRPPPAPLFANDFEPLDPGGCLRSGRRRRSRAGAQLVGQGPRRAAPRGRRRRGRSGALAPARRARAVVVGGGTGWQWGRAPPIPGLPRRGGASSSRLVAAGK